ncbi:MAG TPA: sodium:proton antiporter [Candidatus Kapabacteria bacterium]|jgi:Na+/H+ antiporter NhaD/arsenite permease-like protein|nr:sodium:proton antiporter [Candidatus Kapabacteria bacterium]HOV91496.1 sodium:proton antiporter [Candidatus Kapabacteria bacterium]
MENLPNIPLWAGIPFVLMLGAIAVLPLAAPKFWESNRNKLIVALILGIPTAVWMLSNGLTTELEHTIVFDYLPFVVLLGSLFVITGGIFISGDIEATPRNNTILLAIGAVLASLMGTTGASMLLIRPLLKINSERKKKVHSILFFIAIVANAGGLLTPLGDPPLFMLYLRGVHFTWFLNLLPEWLVTNLILLIVYYIVDVRQYKKENSEDIAFDKSNVKKIRIEGNLNFVWLLGVVLSVAIINPLTIPSLGNSDYATLIREVVILGLAACSLIFTKKEVHQNNEFSWSPILEVAYLFLGIFITMVPVLAYLESNAATIGINHPIQFYYFTGALSSFLDNTPTALTFYSLALGLVEHSPQLFTHLPMVANIPANYLAAISTGAVFFGSMTYIGNGPNFMVKSIAEEQKIPMPHFFAYMYKFSLIVLLPIFIIVQLLFIH